MSARPLVGISSLVGKQDLGDLTAHLDEVEELGVDSIELPIFDMDLIVGGKIRQTQLETLRKACSGRRVGWTVHGPLSINLMDEPFRLPRHFEVLSAALEIAGVLGAKNYVLHSGFRPVQLSDGIEAAYARQREWLARAGDTAKAHGVTICVENLFDDHWGKFHTARASRLAVEITAVGHPHVRATVDFSHAYLDCGFHGFDVTAEVTPLAAVAHHLHIHDSFGRPDDIYMYTTGERLAYGHGDLHLPVGWGSVPWDSLLAACTFPQCVVFNIELDHRYWHLAKETVAATRAMAERCKLAA